MNIVVSLIVSTNHTDILVTMQKYVSYKHGIMY